MEWFCAVQSWRLLLTTLYQPPFSITTYHHVRIARIIHSAPRPVCVRAVIVHVCLNGVEEVTVFMWFNGVIAMVLDSPRIKNMEAKA